VDAAEDVPAPRRALTACSRRHRFLQWVREARGALVACSVRAPGDHDEVIRPGIQDAKDHLESLDELRKGATDDLAKLARKQNEDPQVILNPEKKGEVEEIDPVQKGEDRRAASNARKEALLEAKRKQEEFQWPQFRWEAGVDPVRERRRGRGGHVQQDPLRPAANKGC